MSVSLELQKAITAALRADAAVGALIGDRIFDRPAAGVVYPYARFGPADTVLRASDDCLDDRIEVIQIDVFSASLAGKAEAKAICETILAALTGLEDAVELAAGALVSLRASGLRVFDSPDGRSVQGVITLEAETEGP